VTVPLAIVGAAFLMLLMGFSINLLTLLALVLAIGLVVDDAIVVVENVHRHIEMGKPRMQAAMDAARELALPIVAMTTTLVAVYAPIGFMGGLVGSLFVEFAFTLAAAVLISGIVALTLSPMISARVLRPAGNQAHFERNVEHFFDGLAKLYARMLRWWIKYPSSTVLVALVVIASIWAMYSFSQKELAPTEDQSILFFMATAPQTATVDYNKRYVEQLQRTFEQVPEYQEQASWATRLLPLAASRCPSPPSASAPKWTCSRSFRACLAASPALTPWPSRARACPPRARASQWSLC
jgi:multidrug efflux pump